MSFFSPGASIFFRRRVMATSTMFVPVSKWVFQTCSEICEREKTRPGERIRYSSSENSRWLSSMGRSPRFASRVIRSRLRSPIWRMFSVAPEARRSSACSISTPSSASAPRPAGAASHAADLLTDLKSGYLLGGNPRRQTISQLFGVVAGTIASVPAYLFVVQRDPGRLGSESLPAPSAKVWAGVAELLAKGVDALPSGALVAIAVGAAIGIALTLLEEYAPKSWRPWLPSTTGLGIAGVIPAFNAIAMFAGALLAWLYARARPGDAEAFTVPVSSGLIAGESLMGVAIILGLEVWKLLGR